jgi:CRP/FNR family transcriptional regulator, cyclic AMP receptor protein
MALIQTNRFLGEIRLFSSLSQPQVEWLANQCTWKHVQRQENLKASTDTKDFICLIADGFFKVCFLNDKAQLATHRIVAPHQLLNMSQLFGTAAVREFFVNMNKDCHVLMIPKHAITTLIEQSYTFYEALVAYTANQLRQTEKHLFVLHQQDVRLRIATFLQEVLTNSLDGYTVDDLLKHGLTQQDIAYMIGSTRQTVASILNDMREERKIEFSRKQFRFLKNDSLKLAHL